MGFAMRPFVHEFTVQLCNDIKGIWFDWNCRFVATALCVIAWRHSRGYCVMCGWGSKNTQITKKLPATKELQRIKLICRKCKSSKIHSSFLEKKNIFLCSLVFMLVSVKCPLPLQQRTSKNINQYLHIFYLNFTWSNRHTLGQIIFMGWVSLLWCLMQKQYQRASQYEIISWLSGWKRKYFIVSTIYTDLT